jgi:hypothetical protein
MSGDVQGMNRARVGCLSVAEPPPRRDAARAACRPDTSTAPRGARVTQPYIVPITFSYDERHLYAFGTPGNAHSPF